VFLVVEDAATGPALRAGALMLDDGVDCSACATWASPGSGVDLSMVVLVIAWADKSAIAPTSKCNAMRVGVVGAGCRRRLGWRRS
jgi:hypothetical protein